MVTAMRHLVALLLLCVACSAGPTVAPRDCTPGAVSACACPGASGVQTCSADGTLGACVCADAGARVDVTSSSDVAIDAVTPADRPEERDVADAAPTDDGRDPRCPANAPFMCTEGGCWNLQTSNGRIPAPHCGACGNACPESAPECVGGRCTALADAGPPACPAGFDDCDGDRSNGCETNISTVTNCGGCGRACPSGGGYRCCPSSANRCPRADQPCG